VLGLLVTADRALGSSRFEDIDSTSHHPRSFDDVLIPMAPTDEDVVAAELAKLDVTAAAGGGADGGNDDDDASGDETAATADGTPSAAAKKKKKKKKKKKTGGGGGAAGSGAAGQTAPPTVPVSHLFNNVFPEGEIQHYVDDNVWRETSEEKRELERLEKNMYNEVRQCSEVHREVRRYISDWVKPGMKLIDVCGAFIFIISVIKRMGDQTETDD
jgi:methionyl aminopeptidase